MPVNLPTQELQSIFWNQTRKISRVRDTRRKVEWHTLDEALVNHLLALAAHVPRVQVFTSPRLKQNQESSGPTWITGRCVLRAAGLRRNLDRSTPTASTKPW